MPSSVARVRLRLAGSDRYPEVIAEEAATDNIAVFHVDRPAEEALSPTLEWLDSAGNSMRTVRAGASR